MAIRPDSDIRLLKCPLSLDNKNQLTFFTKEEQENYFLSRPFIEEDECFYQRKDNIIRFPAHIDDIINYNYVMYKNNNYSDKWFYAFILNMEYVTDNLTYITIGTDVWQTWQFDIDINECFVEREHVSKHNDGTGKNLEPENLEIGEPIISNVDTNIDILEPAFVIAYSRNPYDDQIATTNVYTSNINGMPNGLYYFVCDSYTLIDKIDEINTAGLGQNIITVFTIPRGAVLGYVDSTGTEWTRNKLSGTFGDWISSFKAKPFELSVPGFPMFGGYQPKNNKLYNYPFNYLGINPPNGTQKIIRYEDLIRNESKFKFVCEINPNPTAFLIPYKYRNSPRRYSL